ncbi:putative polysaccharide deacetylase YheN [Niallia sp. NCCP-28]|nr:putative polysaccharide deacetylase YheN [Niallia sp. NCCP-28]
MEEKQEKKSTKSRVLIYGTSIFCVFLTGIFILNILAEKTEGSMRKQVGTLQEKKLYHKPLPQDNALINEQKKTAAKKLQAEEKHKKVVYLTFDDGPSAASSSILAQLKKYNAKATFFYLEPNMETYSNMVIQAHKEGHSIGLHGVTHNVKKVYATTTSVVEEMDRTNEELEKIIDQKSMLIRTPYGSKPYMNEKSIKNVEKAGYIIWDWDIDSRDWYYQDKRYVKDTIKQLNSLKDRTPVILMHERQATAKQLSQLLDYLDKQGYEFKAINEYMEPVHF